MDLRLPDDSGTEATRAIRREFPGARVIALTSYDQATRKKAYARIQQILVDRVPLLTMWWFRRFDVVNDDFKGYKPAHAVTTFWNTWEYDI